MPKEFLTAAGNDTTWDFYNYGRPLLGSGLPQRAPHQGAEGGEDTEKREIA